MKEFPKIDPNQVVLLRADANTGHILDDNYDLVTSDSQNVYTVFNSIEEAVNYSNKELIEKENIEIIIYGSEMQVLHFLVK